MWAYNSIFYQIYPIGFCGAPVHNDGVCVPRIRKLMDWSEYLQTLGVDSILLNPIFESDNMIQEILRRSTAGLERMKILKRSVKICINIT